MYQSATNLNVSINSIIEELKVKNDPVIKTPKIDAFFGFPIHSIIYRLHLFVKKTKMADESFWY
jgi:hypothetical protein